MQLNYLNYKFKLMSVEKIKIFDDDKDDEKETGVSDQNEDQEERPQRSPESELEIVPNKKKDEKLPPSLRIVPEKKKEKKPEEKPN